MTIRRSTVIVWSIIGAYAAVAVVAGLADTGASHSAATFPSDAKALCARTSAEQAAESARLKEKLDKLFDQGSPRPSALSAAVRAPADLVLRPLRDLRELVPPAESGLSVAVWRAGIDAAIQTYEASYRKLDDLAAGFPQLEAAMEKAAATAPDPPPTRTGPDGRELGPTAAIMADAMEIPAFRAYMKALQEATPDPGVVGRFNALLDRAGMTKLPACKRFMGGASTP